MPDRLPEPDYPDDFEVRRVSSTGGIKWRGSIVRLGNVLCQQAVGVETIAEGLLRLWFGHVYLGELREKAKGVNEFIANKA